MSYAQHRKIIDADSHVIELDDFLMAAAKEEDKSLIPAMSSQKELPVIQEGLDRGRELFAKRQEDPSVMAKFEDSILDNRKSGWNRIGAFDSGERSHALDVFGYSMQWILPTFAFHQIAHTDSSEVLDRGAQNFKQSNGKFLFLGRKAQGYWLCSFATWTRKSTRNNAGRFCGRLLLLHDRYQRTK